MRYLSAVLLFFCLQAQAETTDKTIIGWIETVRIMPEKFELTAKIDSGADNSSLDVISWKTYSHQDEEWIRFDVINNNEDTITFERPLEGYTLIKRKRAEPVERPVVSMKLCIGNHIYLAPVNLAERKGFKYRMLIGRSFLKGRFLVDSAVKQSTLPQCNSL
ncbi:MAG: RimK/LysX family protein [Gammaproteobacteria bacterium]|nr:RimK/LysX family protein [Gammaproteobacteria bacterium]